MADIIQIRRDTASAWTSANPTLASGELGLETDTGKLKVGDASTAWTSLAYYTLATTGYAPTSGNLSQFAATTSAQLAGVLSDETGSGAAVFATSPTLVTPALGTPSALVLTNATGTLTSPTLVTPALGTPASGVATNLSGTAASLTAGNVTTNANLTGHVTSTGNAAVLGSFTSAQLSTALSDETGSGAAVFATSPTLVTPALGTPASGVMTNTTGTASGLTAGNVTTNANLTGHVTSTGNAAVLGSFTSAQLAAALTNETGSGAAVFGTAPTLTGATLAGELAGADNTVSRINLKDYGEVTNAIGGTGGGTQDIDIAAGNCVSATVDTSANTFTFSNPTASDELCGFVLFLTNGGSQTVTWPGTVDWPSATAPTLSASGVDILVFQTINGGTTWHGQVSATLSS